MALCHEWLSDRHGSEKTFQAMAEALPDADLHALTWNRDRVPFDRPVATTALDRLGPLRDRRDLLLPVMPLAWRYSTRRRYDVVVTSSHACAKGFRPGRAALHLCYCYTPLRYVWFSGVDRRGPIGPAQRLAARGLRAWDRGSARWVDEFAAISGAVRDRIRDVYGRPARVIHPPVDTDFFTPAPEPVRPGFALAVSRFVPYKRLDLAVRACRAAGCPLVVAGAGPEEGRLRHLAAVLKADVTFVIGPSDEALRELYRTASALVFPAEEDFGIVAVEAQACGTPVVALAAGGSLDTVQPGRTGVLVRTTDEAEWAAAVDQALRSGTEVDACRAHALSFSGSRFRAQLRDWVASSAAGRGLRPSPVSPADASP
ncbi:MAG TPA: glycosyltransferase [Acidimicrobiales bacterium]|nr:glycosyltransferase [Acidimicrobiales bacterium]